MNLDNVDILINKLDKEKVLDFDQLLASEIFTNDIDLDVAIYESISLKLVEVEMPRPNSGGVSRGFKLTKEGCEAVLLGSTKQYLEDGLNLTRNQLQYYRKVNKVYWYTFWFGIVAAIFAIGKTTFDVTKERSAPTLEAVEQIKQRVDSLEQELKNRDRILLDFAKLDTLLKPISKDSIPQQKP